METTVPAYQLVEEQAASQGPLASQAGETPGQLAPAPGLIPLQHAFDGSSVGSPAGLEYDTVHATHNTHLAKAEPYNAFFGSAAAASGPPVELHQPCPPLQPQLAQQQYYVGSGPHGLPGMQLAVFNTAAPGAAELPVAEAGLFCLARSQSAGVGGMQWQLDRELLGLLS